MKKIMKLFVLVATVAMTLASCQKNEIAGPVKKDVHFTLKANIVETKTAITDNGDGTYSPTWKEEDKIGVLFALEEKAKVVDFENTAVAGDVATFEGKHAFTVEEGAAEVDGNLYAFYPSSAFNKMYSDGGVRLDLENTQYPTSTSFDPSCDLLIAKPCYYMAEATGEAAEVLIDDMYFARMMSVLKINLNSEFLTNETVKSVSFDADGVDFTGAMKFNLETGEFVGNQSASSQDLSEVKAVYSEEDPIAVAGDKNSAYLVVAPVTILSGTALTFTIETENYDIVKTVSAPSDMVMPAGNIAVINLNIKEDDCVAKTESDFSGTYAILTKRTTGGFWYMTNDLGTASTKRFTAEEAGGTLPEEGVTLGASKLWEVSKLGEYYTVKSIGAEKYITWTSGNSANLGDEGILFTITMTNEGFYNLSYAASDATRYLSLNQTSGSDYFALYKEGQKKDLALIRAKVVEEPSTLSVTAPGQVSADGGKGSFTYILTNPKDGIQLSAITEATWITDITVGDEKVAYTVSPNTSEDVREAVITLTYGDLTESVKITQAGKPAEGGEESGWISTTFANLKDGDQVVIVSTKDSDIYALPHNNGSSSEPHVVDIAYANDKLTSEPDETIVWTVSIDGTNYTFHPNGDKTKWLYCTNTNNGVRVGTNDNKHFVLDSNTGFLKNIATSRYLGVYNNQDWRCYTNTTGNIAGQTFQFFMKSGTGSETPDPEQPETPATPVLTITENPTSDIAAEGDVVTVKYSVTNPVEGQSVTASANVEWIEGFDYTVAGEVSFIVYENTGAARNATVTLAYEGATSQTVTINQAAAQGGGDEPEQPVEPVEYTLLFGSSYNSKPVGSYTDTWTATNGDFTCTLVNWNNNQNGWDYVKAGRKNNASVATITTAAVPEALTTVTMTVDALTKSKINSLKLYVSTDSNFTTKDTYTATAAQGDVVFNISKPVANAYYKIEVDCASGSSNGLITVSKVVYTN